MSAARKIAGAAAALTLSAGIAHATPINDTPMLDLLGKIEGPEGYTQVVHSAKLDPPKPITRMTIAEVLDYQRDLRRAGSRSSAIGRYQFIYKTLQQIVDDFNVDTGQKFNRRTQDFLARRMLERCHFYDPDASHAKIGNCMARTWAALPVISGPKRGRSYYHGVAGNRALTTPQKVVSLINIRFQDPNFELKARQHDMPDPGDVPFATPIPLNGSSPDQGTLLAQADQAAQGVASAKVWMATFQDNDSAAVAVPLK